MTLSLSSLFIDLHIVPFAKILHATKVHNGSHVRQERRYREKDTTLLYQIKLAIQHSNVIFQNLFEIQAYLYLF